MNKTNTHGFRPYAASPTQNKMMKSTMGVGFRTLWKDRDTHQLSTKKKSTQILQKKDLKENTNENSLSISRQTINQQEMKNFIKNMKKTSDESDQPVKTIESPQRLIKCHSSRSIRSETRSLCESGVFETLETAPVFTLDELEKKIEELIQIKLWKKSKTRTFFNSQLFEDDIDMELKNLMKEVRNYGQGNPNSFYCEEENKNEENLDVCLKEIKRKIGIIEKVIAESYTQSEILKKYYSASKLKSPKNISLLNSKIIKTPINNSMFTSSMPSACPSIYFQTTSMSSYGKPTASSYSLEKYQRAPYLANRQPLPRSNYQREFLNYGVVPTYSNKLDNPNAITPNNISMKNRLTNYQNEFKEKKVKLVDSHTLDCRLDKFRNLKINFMPPKHPSFNEEEYKKMQNKAKKFESSASHSRQISRTNIPYENEKESNKENIFNMIKALKSEQKQNFTGSKCTIESYVKDRNLNNLKYSYKLNFNA